MSHFAPRPMIYVCFPCSSRNNEASWLRGSRIPQYFVESTSGSCEPLCVWGCVCVWACVSCVASNPSSASLNMAMVVLWQGMTALSIGPLFSNFPLVQGLWMLSSSLSTRPKLLLGRFFSLEVGRAGNIRVPTEAKATSKGLIGVILLLFPVTNYL